MKASRSRQETGQTGEDMAIAFLEVLGYRILERNWRFRRFEVDIIAAKNGILHIVEVKTKKGNRGGYPESRVDHRKFKFLQAASDAYRHKHPQWQMLQFDIVSITLQAGGREPEFFLIEDVYYW